MVDDGTLIEVEVRLKEVEGIVTDVCGRPREVVGRLIETLVVGRTGVVVGTEAAEETGGSGSARGRSEGGLSWAEECLD